MRVVCGIIVVVLLSLALVQERGQAKGTAATAAEAKIQELEGKVLFLEGVVSTITRYLPKDIKRQIKSRCQSLPIRATGLQGVKGWNKARNKFIMSVQ